MRACFTSKPRVWAHKEAAPENWVLAIALPSTIHCNAKQPSTTQCKGPSIPVDPLPHICRVKIPCCTPTQPGVPLHVVTDSELVYLGLACKCQKWQTSVGGFTRQAVAHRLVARTVGELETVW